MKVIIMEVTANLIFPKDGDQLVIPPEFEMKQTEDGINYLVKEEKDVATEN